MKEQDRPKLRIGMSFDEVCAELGQPMGTNKGSQILGGKGKVSGVSTGGGMADLRSRLFFTKYASWQRPEGYYDLVFEHERLARVSTAPEGVSVESTATDEDLLPARFVWVVTDGGSDTPQEVFDTMRRQDHLPVTPDAIVIGDVLPDVAVDLPTDSVMTRGIVCALKALASAGQSEDFLDLDSLRVRRFRPARAGSAGLLVMISGPASDPSARVTATLTRKKQREVCGKCGITMAKRMKEWNALVGIKLGDDRGAFMFCPQCEEGICGRCSVDLGLTAGCPQCRTELVYMDGGKQ